MYLKNVEKSTITKFINANQIIEETTDAESYNDIIYDRAFDYSIEFIQQWLKKHA